MDWRTASSNSMGPGIRREGWAGWDDILGDVLDAICCLLADT